MYIITASSYEYEDRAVGIFPSLWYFDRDNLMYEDIAGPCLYHIYTTLYS